MALMNALYLLQRLAKYPAECREGRWFLCRLCGDWLQVLAHYESSLSAIVIVVPTRLEQYQPLSSCDRGAAGRSHGGPATTCLQ
jgi:hypothetical protein